MVVEEWKADLVAVLGCPLGCHSLRCAVHAVPAGLSAEPHVSGVLRLGEGQGGILVIASDGMWDVADPEAVVAAVLQADR